MFGYITADFRKLSKSAKKDYKAAYCGLCRALSKRYSAKARFLLSFDTTFLSIVLATLNSETSCQKCACPYRFGAKKNCLTGKYSDYAADVTVLLACMNFEDDIKDDKSLRAKILKLVYRREFEKAKKIRPELFEGLLRGIVELERAERRGEQNPDVPADIFGQMLSQVFAIDERLDDFGYYLGKFIYLCDAVCDFKSDLKHKRYNALTGKRMADFENILSYNVDKCRDIADDLSLDSEIIKNVLESGIWLRYSIKYKRKV